MQRCSNLGDSFYCLSPEGKRLPPVKVEAAPRMECFLPDDWEARKNWEEVLKQ